MVSRVLWYTAGMTERSPRVSSKEFQKLMDDIRVGKVKENPVVLTPEQKERESQLDTQIGLRLQRAVETSMQPVDLKGGWGLKLAGDEESAGVAFNDAETASLEDLQKALDETPEEERRYPFNGKSTSQQKLEE